MVTTETLAVETTTIAKCATAAGGSSNAAAAAPAAAAAAAAAAAVAAVAAAAAENTTSAGAETESITITETSAEETNTTMKPGSEASSPAVSDVPHSDARKRQAKGKGQTEGVAGGAETTGGREGGAGGGEEAGKGEVGRGEVKGQGEGKGLREGTGGSEGGEGGLGTSSGAVAEAMTESRIEGLSVAYSDVAEGASRQHHVRVDAMKEANQEGLVEDPDVNPAFAPCPCPPCPPCLHSPPLPKPGGSRQTKRSSWKTLTSSLPLPAPPCPPCPPCPSLPLPALPALPAPPCPPCPPCPLPALPALPVPSLPSVPPLFPPCPLPALLSSPPQQSLPNQVEAGDTMCAIADRYCVRVDAMKEANQEGLVEDPDVIFPGDLLVVPPKE
ncbi:unnamed protein product [Closterium sp. Naga37s-1]|nr:unnamed protein product [Closterium sp. Naga37s-1]